MAAALNVRGIRLLNFDERSPTIVRLEHFLQHTHRMLGLPTELAHRVIDHLSLAHLIRASHVCRDWRVVAQGHPTFCGAAELVATEYLTSAAVEFFLARISAANGPVDVVLDLLHKSSVIEDTILPVLALHLQRVASLHINIPERYIPQFLYCLNAPAPMLRTVILGDRRDRGCDGTLAIPIGLSSNRSAWAADFPPHFDPDFALDSITALSGVERVSIMFPLSYTNVELNVILAVFPSIRHLQVNRLSKFPAHPPLLVMSEPLAERHNTVVLQLQSLDVDHPSVHVVRSLQASRIPSVTVSVSFTRSTLLEESRRIVQEILPPSSALRVTVKFDDVSISSPDCPGHEFRMRSDLEVLLEGGARAFMSFFGFLGTLSGLVQLSIHGVACEGLSSADIDLPALDTLHVAYLSPKAICRSRDDTITLVRCKNLRVVVLQLYAATGAVPHRTLTDYITSTLSVTTWASVCIALENISTFGTQATNVVLRFVAFDEVAADMDVWLRDRVVVSRIYDRVRG